MTRTRRLLAATGAAVAALVALAPAASAHVEVAPDQATKGEDAVLTFQVPNEEDSAGTTTVEINFPTDHPIPFVSVKPLAGWTYKIDKTKLATPVSAEGEDVTEVVSKVTFTGGPIKPNEFEEFQISAGPLPKDTDALSFPTLQTYENGDVVRWIEETPTGGEEPEHPVPVVQLVAASNDDAAASTSDGGSSSAAAAVKQSDVDSAKTLAIVGLVIGLLGLVVAVVALVRGRRTPTTKA